MKKFGFVLLIVAFLTSCTATNEDVGAVAGGTLGGLVGSQFGGGSGKVLATVGGVMVGTVLGSNVGRYMDRVDRLEMQRALETAPTGRSVNWKNPDNGNRFVVKPTRTYYKENHRPCREYTTTATIGGKTEQIYGRACRNSDGSWEIVK